MDNPDTAFLLNDFKPPVATLRPVSGGTFRSRYDGRLTATGVSYACSGSVTLFAPPPDSTFTTMTWPLHHVLFRYLAQQAALVPPKLKQDLDAAMAQETDTTLTVNDATIAGRSVCWGNVRLHAGRIDSGWTVVALVPADADPVVDLVQR